MPCNTIQRTTIQEELKGLNQSLLLQALTAIGFSANIVGAEIRFQGYLDGAYYTGTYSKDKFTTQSTSSKKVDLNLVKKSYAAQVVQRTAKAKGWKLKKTGAFSYEATKN